MFEKVKRWRDERRLKQERIERYRKGGAAHMTDAERSAAFQGRKRDSGNA